MRTAKRLHDEKGQILLIFVFMLTLLIGLVAMVIDVGNFLRTRGHMQNVVDASALAGVQALPDDTALALSLANQYALANDPSLDLNDLNVTFYCIVGDDGGGQPASSHIPGVCDPGLGGSFTCDGTRCYSVCDISDSSSKCNTILVGGSKEVPFIFAPVIGISSNNTGDIRAAACSGSCGGPPTVPLDVAMIIDRTGSMSSSELQDAKNAAKGLLELYNPNLQHVALGVLGASDPSDLCRDQDPNNGGSWVAVPLSSNYKNADGTLNTSSSLVDTIDCLDNSSQGTNLGSPIQDLAYGQPDAMSHLLSAGRPGLTKAIVLFTDGAANEPDGDGPGIYRRNSCLYARDMAAAAKAAGIVVYSLGYGLESAECDDDDPPYRNTPVTELLADMATDSFDETGCDNATEAAQENADGDHFFCETASSGLIDIFQQVGEELAAGVRLVRLPG